jgi:hypothetical protein
VRRYARIEYRRGRSIVEKSNAGNPEMFGAMFDEIVAFSKNFSSQDLAGEAFPLRP